MNAVLRTNICRITHPTLLNNEIPDLASRLEEYVPEALSYSCQYWVEHVKLASNKDANLLHLVHEFCRNHVLRWLEVMSLKRVAGDGIVGFLQLRDWLPVSNTHLVF
jgi:hypothetical protein